MELNSTLQQIDSLKKEAEGLRLVAKPEWEMAFWDKFRLEFNYNSNHMEGNTLTYGHTQILLKSGDVVGKYNIRELQEMKAHDLALKLIRNSAEDPEFSLSQKFIKEINQTILVEPFYNEAVTPDGRPTQKLITPGEYKRTPNSVRLPNGEMFYYASPEETPALMMDLMDWYQKESAGEELHPVQIAALFHYKFVKIHPFDDSNGRTARLLMNYILLRNEYAPLVIESEDKKNYLIALNEADAGNIEAFVEYITNLALRWQLLYGNALRGEKIEEKDDFDKEVELLKRQLSKKEEVEAKKTKQLVEMVLIESFLPLLENIEKKLESLKPLFFDHSIEINGNNSNKKITSVAELKGLYQNFVSQLLNGGPIEVKFTHTGLIKTGKRNFYYLTRIRLSCETYEFIIRANENKDLIIKKHYNDSLSVNESELFVETLAKNELESIKKKL